MASHPPIESSQTICWIFRDKGAGTGEGESKRFQGICDTLSRHGYTLLWLPVPAKGSAITGEWLLEHLPATARIVFCSDADIGWMRDLTNGLRGIMSSVPVIWLYAPREKPSLDVFTDLGLDDIFPASISEAELLLRLKVRLKHAGLLARLEHEMKEQEVRIAKAETALKQREEFLGVCAHDLRSPLGLIQSSLSMVLGGEGSTSLGELHVELLTRAKRQTGQALTLVNDLLDVMAFEHGLRPQYQLLNLHEVLAEFHKDYCFQAEQKGVKFHYENPIQDWRVLADADRIRQLLQNLITNALKFTDKGKNIHLNVTPFQGRRKADPPYPMIIISLKDEGKGIPQKEMQKIFDRFTQVKNYSRPDGRGLGLTVAKQISTLHDGNIWVQSEEGKGSTFFVLFPHVVSKTALEREPDRLKKVLVVEPSFAKRAEYFDAMNQWGYEVLYAKDGVEVITYLYHYNPDAIILTAGLVKMDEGDVANVIKADPLTGSVPLIMALEAGQRARKGLENVLYDQAVDLPLTKETFENSVKEIRKKLATAQKPVKKAA